MTAFDLIDSFFARPQENVAANTRFISARQLAYLKDLIGSDPEGSAMERVGPGRWYWMPAGREKYEITEDYKTGRNRIARLRNVVSTGTGRLF